MNKINLTGTIKNIQSSHNIDDIQYDEADLVVKRPNSPKDDIIKLKFKKFSNPYKENDFISLVGNIRSYSKKISDDKNQVQVYCFTYFDKADETCTSNDLILDGTICKKDILRKSKFGKDSIHFILANNIISNDNKCKINSYLPCVAYGKNAHIIDNLNVKDKIQITGQLRIRYYKKFVAEGEYETRVATEVYVSTIEAIK